MPQHRSTRSQAQPNLEDLSEDEVEKISFWDIQFGDLNAISRKMQVFVPDEKAKLFNMLTDFIEKKNPHSMPFFLDRVPIQIAPDYRSIIPAEMYFSLIKDRINNGYYRSQEQLLSDIDLISYNARIYNGEHHEISLSAKELCEQIRVRLKSAMFIRSETYLNQQVASAAKLIEPSTLRLSFKVTEQVKRTTVTIQTTGARGAASAERNGEAGHLAATEQTMPASSSSLVRITRAQPPVEETKESNIVHIQIAPSASVIQLASDGGAPGSHQMASQPSQADGLKNADRDEVVISSMQDSNLNSEVHIPARVLPAAGRRRNRAQAGGQSVEELEVKTRSDGGAIADREEAEESSMGVTKRVTRNNQRKRTRYE